MPVNLKQLEGGGEGFYLTHRSSNTPQVEQTILRIGKLGI